MTTRTETDRTVAEGRFAEVFAHLDFLVQYVRRRGGRDPEGLAAEAMAIAWRKLSDVPADDARPWLIVTVRNLMLAQYRREPSSQTQPLEGVEVEGPADQLPFELELDPELAWALAHLGDGDREALLLIAWDDLTPALAAKSLGISAPAFRARLHRARGRLARLLTAQASARPVTTSQHQWRQTA